MTARSAAPAWAMLAALGLAQLSGCNPLTIRNPPSLLGYVAQQNTNTVAVFDAIQNTPVGNPIRVGLGPTRLVGDPTGTQDYLYVLNSQSNSVSFLNRRTQQVDYNVSVGASPTDLAVTPSGRFLYVANSGDSSVTRIDLRTRNVARIVLSAAQGQQGAGSTPVPVGLAVDPAPVVNDPANPVYRTYVVCRTAGASGGTLLTVRDDSPAQDSIFVNLTANNAVSPWRATVAAAFTGGQLTSRKLYVTDTGANFLQIVDLGATPIAARQSPTLNSFGWGLAASPDGQFVYVTLPNFTTGQGTNGAIVRLATQTDQFEPALATLGSQPQPIAINANGTSVYVGDNGNSATEVFPVAGTGSGSRVITPRFFQFTNNVNTAQPPSDIALTGGT